MPGSNPIETVDPTVEAATGTLDPEPTLAVKITVEGKTDNGQTLALSDIANSLTFSRDGRPFQSESFEFWSEINQLWYGDVSAPSGNTNAEERVVAYCLMYQPELLQALDVAPDNLRYNLQFNTGTLTTRFGSNPVTAEIEQITARSLPELYTPYVLADDEDVGTTASGSGETYQEPNITRLFFRESGGLVVSDVMIMQDGVTEVSNTDLAGLNDESRLFNRVENNVTPPYVEYTSIERVGQVSLFNNRTEYRVQASTGGTLEVTRMRVGDVQDRDRLRAALGA